MKTVHICKLAGAFAENKDIAKSIRVQSIMPSMEIHEEVVLDFSDVTGATQSFIHALISESIRQYGNEVFELIKFRNCTPVVKEVIMIVSEYMQES